jgi:diguanylate cyclase (GGDEF)-like protein
MGEHDPASDRREQELTSLNEIAKALTSTLQLSEVMRIVLARIKALTFAEAISLLLYDAQRHELVFSATETMRESVFAHFDQSPEEGITAWAAITGKSALVNDAEKDPRCAGGRDGPAGEGQRLLVVPIKRGGKVIGVVQVADRYDAQPFEHDDLQALEAIAQEVAPQIDTEMLVQESPMLRDLLARISAAVRSQAVSLFLYDASGNRLAFSASRRLEAGTIDGFRMSADRGIAGWVARNREPLRLEDASQDPRYNRDSESMTKFRPRAMMCVPVVSRDRLLGVIQVMNRLDGKSFDDYEFRLVQILAEYAAIAIENASLYKQAQVAALTDDLTGLGNTRRFNQVLPEQLRLGQPVSLIVTDFDNFKQVVDRYGHRIGSLTIAQIGKMIGELLRPTDFAARFGGDEFVIVLPATRAEEALDVAERIRQAVEACQHLDGHEVDISGVTVSIGVAVFPDHAADADGLFHAADAAMYRTKHRGKNGVTLAGPS